MKHAAVLLKSDGNVLITHSAEWDIGTPTSNAGDLENLLNNGYLIKRETVIGGGQTLLVLEKAE